MKTTGERIRQAREYRGVSADALAREVGYKTQSGISNLENRAVGRGGYKLEDIAKALDFAVEWFLRGPDVDDMSLVPKYSPPLHAEHIKPLTSNRPQPELDNAVLVTAHEHRALYATNRRHAHSLLDALSELGIEKANSVLEALVIAYPRSDENGAGVSLPARLKRQQS